MRNRRVSAITPRPSWGTYQADAMVMIPCHDGSGDDLSEINGLFNTGDYTGTTTNLWQTEETKTYGVQPAGDGAWLSQDAALQNILDMRNPGRLLLAWDITYTGANLSAVNTMLSFGAQNLGNGTDGNGGGFLRVALYDSGADFGIRIIYRDGEDEDASATYSFTATNQTINTADILSAGDGSTNVRHHVALLITNDGAGALSIKLYTDGVLRATLTPTLNGTQRPFLKSETGFCIGDRLSAGVTEAGSERLGGGGSGAKIANILMWYDADATEAAAVAVLTDHYRLPNERPSGL